MSQEDFCTAMLKQAIKDKNIEWFAGNNSPLSYKLVHSILSWIPKDGKKTYKQRIKIMDEINHTLTSRELYTISQSNNIAQTAMELDRCYDTVYKAKRSLKGL